MRGRGLNPVHAVADPSRRYNGNGVAVITSLSTDDTERPIHLRGVKADEPRRYVLLDLTEDEARKVAADILSLLEARRGLTP